VFCHLIQSRKRVYTDCAVQVRIVVSLSAVTPVSLDNFQVDFFHPSAKCASTYAGFIYFYHLVSRLAAILPR